jgi:hypothetical protein
VAATAKYTSRRVRIPKTCVEHAKELSESYDRKGSKQKDGLREESFIRSRLRTVLLSGLAPQAGQAAFPNLGSFSGPSLLDRIEEVAYPVSQTAVTNLSRDETAKSHSLSTSRSPQTHLNLQVLETMSLSSDSNRNSPIHPESEVLEFVTEEKIPTVNIFDLANDYLERSVHSKQSAQTTDPAAYLERMAYMQGMKTLLQNSISRVVLTFIVLDTGLKGPAEKVTLSRSLPRSTSEEHLIETLQSKGASRPRRATHQADGSLALNISSAPRKAAQEFDN